MIVEFIIDVSYVEKDYLFHSINFPIRPIIGERIFISEFSDILIDNAYEHKDEINGKVSEIREKLSDDYYVASISHNFSKKGCHYLVVTLTDDPNKYLKS